MTVGRLLDAAGWPRPPAMPCHNGLKAHSQDKMFKKRQRSGEKRNMKKNIGTPIITTWIGRVADSAEGTHFASFEVFVAAMSGSRMLKQRAEKFDANINKRGNVKLCMALT